MKTHQRLQDALRRTADTVAGTAQSAAQTFADAARSTPGVVAEAAQKVADTARAVPHAVSDAVDNITHSVKNGVDYVDARVQATRTGTANALTASGVFLGTATMVAGETALFSAGILPVLFFYDLPIKAGDRVTETIDDIAKFVRGDRVQFIGINIVGGVRTPKDVRAVIYDPHMPNQDRSGYVQLSEEDVVRQLKIMNDTPAARERQYTAALVAVQEARKRYGLPLKSRGVGLDDAVGILDILSAAAMAGGPG